VPIVIENGSNRILLRYYPISVVIYIKVVVGAIHRLVYYTRQGTAILLFIFYIVFNEARIAVATILLIGKTLRLLYKMYYLYVLGKTFVW